MSRTVLLVCADKEQLTAREEAVGPLADKVYLASTFPLAKSILLEAKPDVLVTDLRLHAFNGIHLALWSRVCLPHLRSVIIGQTDPSLAADARAFGFDYVQDGSPAAIVDHTLRALDTALPQRRWPRKRLAFPLSAEIGGARVALFDVGHGGFRLQMGEGAPDVDTTFQIRIADAGIRTMAKCVWIKALPGPIRWCGASVSDRDTTAAPWRAFVDALESDVACVPGTTAL